MDINSLRAEIDSIDDRLVRLFSERMRVSAGIARYKAENNLPVYDKSREQIKLTDILNKTDADLHVYMEMLYTRIFELSRSFQESRISMWQGKESQ